MTKTRATINGIRLQPAVNIKGVMKAATVVGVSEESEKTLFSSKGAS